MWPNKNSNNRSTPDIDGNKIGQNIASGNRLPDR